MINTKGAVGLRTPGKCFLATSKNFDAIGSLLRRRPPRRARGYDQVTPNRHLAFVAASKPLPCLGIDPPIERSTDLCAETRARKRGIFARDQPPVEPGRPLCHDLLVEIEIRADGERDALTALRIVEAAQFHSTVDRTIIGRFDVRKLEMMNAAVDDGDC
jgi:hypothetical protein